MRRRTRPRTRHTPLTATALAAVLALTLAACGGDTPDQGQGQGQRQSEGHGHDHDQGHDSELADVSGGTAPDQGTVLDQPFDKPDLVLTDTRGQGYDLAAETDGHATLLFFGYTHCPDVCPLTMSNIALATAELSDAQREKLRVVFVTTDPERDTPEALGSWLRAQDPDFVGLTGDVSRDFPRVQQAARSLGIPIEPAYEDENGDIVSTHGSQVIAFLPTDDKAHVIYTEGVSAETFKADLPRLIAGKTP